MQRDFILSALDPENWRPNITQISRETGVATSTIKRRIETMRKKGTLAVVVKEYTDSEAMLRKQEDKTDGRKH